MIGPDGFHVAPTHHSRPMTYKGTRVWWAGDFKHHVIRFACDCGFTCEVATCEMDGGPEAARRRQEEGRP